MKKLFIYVALLVSGAAAITGCTKKSDSSTPTYSMKATVGSGAFNGSSCIAVLSGTNLSVVGGPFVNGVASYPNVSITILNYTGTGTYTIQLGSTTNLNTASYYTSMTQAAPAAYGSVTVNATSPMTGTFNFTLTDSTKITNGTFTCAKP